MLARDTSQRASSQQNLPFCPFAWPVDCNYIIIKSCSRADHVTSHKMVFPLCSVRVLRLPNIERTHFNGTTSRNTKMAILHFPWNDSRCTGRYPDVCDTGQDTTEEHRRE